jgi:phosphonate transport system permease protein
MAASGLLPVPQHAPFLEWRKGAVSKRWKQTATAIALALLMGLASHVCEVHWATLLLGISKGIPIVKMFFPPEWSGTATMLQPLGITAGMALTATILGMCLSLPCALAASSNLAPTPLRLAMRTFIGLERGMPEIVQLLLFVAIFGLGAVPGLVALSLSSIGMLAKLLADAIEEIEPSMLEAVAATGATRSQVIRYAVIPQVLPALLSNALFRFEFNVRQGIILGAVGAGGIGYVMSSAMNSLDFQKASMATLLTLGLVFCSERISDRLRARIFQGGLQP